MKDAIRIKLKRPNRGGYNGKEPIGVADIITSLPNETCFFDCKHWVVGIEIFPFAVTTRISANMQQWLKIYEDGYKTCQND